jgi:hypothetical protein
MGESWLFGNIANGVDSRAGCLEAVIDLDKTLVV